VAEAQPDGRQVGLCEVEGDHQRWSAEVLLEVAAERHRVVGEAGRRGESLGLGEPERGVLPDGREQAEALGALDVDTSADQRVVEQDPQVAQHVVATDGLHTCQREAAREDRQRRQQVARRLVEQVVAPVERRPHRALPLGQVAGTLAEDVVEAGQQRNGVEERGRRRSELDGERQPVEAPADVGDRVVLVGGAREASTRRGRARVEELDAGVVGEGLDADDVLGPDAERRPARREHDELRAVRRQGREVRGRVEDLLEVVEQQEHPPARQEGSQPVRGAAVARLRDAERGRDRRNDEAGVGDGGDVDPRRSAREPVRHVCGGRHRERRLAHAPGTRERDHTRRRVAQHVGEDGELLGPADQPTGPGERGARCRRVGRGPARHRTHETGSLPVVEVEGVGQRPDGVRVGAAALAALQGTDGLDRDAGPVGQLLLGQGALVAEGPEQLGEAGTHAADSSHRLPCAWPN
jgi:hypothetical protein